jgi:hypothetical protein
VGEYEDKGGIGEDSDQSFNRIALCPPTRPYPLCKTIAAIVEVSLSYKANLRT